jgi:hypothetical protein
MFRAAVNPSLQAAGEPSLVRTPRHMTSRAHLEKAQRSQPLSSAVLLRSSPGWPSVASRPTQALDPCFFRRRP